MNDGLTATDDVTATGPLPVLPGMEPDPTPPAVDVPAPDAPELETEAPAPPREAVAADAKNRATRSAFQSTLVAAGVSALGVCATYLADGDLSHLDWKLFAAAVAVAAGQPVASYLHRMLGK